MNTKSHRFSMTMRIISVILITAFFLQDIAWAAPDKLQVELRTTLDDFKIASTVKYLVDKAQKIALKIGEYKPDDLSVKDIEDCIKAFGDVFIGTELVKSDDNSEILIIIKGDGRADIDHDKEIVLRYCPKGKSLSTPPGFISTPECGLDKNYEPQNLCRQLLFPPNLHKIVLEGIKTFPIAETIARTPTLQHPASIHDIIGANKKLFIYTTIAITIVLLGSPFWIGVLVVAGIVCAFLNVKDMINEFRLSSVALRDHFIVESVVHFYKKFPLSKPKYSIYETRPDEVMLENEKDAASQGITGDMIQAARAKIFKAIDTLKEKGVELGEGSFIGRAARIESATTILALTDMRTSLIFSVPGKNIFRPIHVGRRRNVIYLSSRLLDDFDIGKKEDMEDLAVLLNHAQRFLDAYNALYASGASPYEMHRGLVQEREMIRGNAEANIGSAERLQARFKRLAVGDADILKDTILPELNNDLQAAKEEEAMLRKQWNEQAHLAEGDRFKNAYVRLANKYGRIGYRWENIGKINKAKHFYKEKARIIKLVQKNDTGVWPVDAEGQLIYFFLRERMYDEFLNELTVFLSGKGFPRPLLDAENNIRLILLSGNFVVRMKREILYELASHEPIGSFYQRRRILAISEKAKALLEEFEKTGTVAIKEEKPLLFTITFPTGAEHVKKQLDELNLMLRESMEAQVTIKEPPGIVEHDPAIVKSLTGIAAGIDLPPSLQELLRESLGDPAVAGYYVDFIINAPEFKDKKEKKSYSAEREQLMMQLEIAAAAGARAAMDGIQEVLISDNVSHDDKVTVLRRIGSENMATPEKLKYLQEILETFLKSANDEYLRTLAAQRLDNVNTRIATNAVSVKEPPDIFGRVNDIDNAVAIILKLRGSQITDSMGERHSLRTSYLKEKQYPVYIEIIRASDNGLVGTSEFKLRADYQTGACILDVGLSAVSDNVDGVSYQNRGINSEVLRMVSDTLPENAILYLGSVNETSTLKAMADGAAWGETKLGGILSKIGWEADLISIFDRDGSETAVLLDRNNKWVDFYDPAKFKAILKRSVEDIEKSDDIYGATLSVSCSKTRRESKLEAPDIAGDELSLRQESEAEHAVTLLPAVLSFLHGLFERTKLRQDSRVLLSESLFIKDGDESGLNQARIALAPLLNSGYIAIMSPNDMRRAAMNQNVSKDKLAIVLTEEDFRNPDIWNDSDKETSLKSSVLIVNDRLTGDNYLYLEGVIGLAHAVMANNKQAIKSYYRLISGIDIDDAILALLGDGGQNNIAFAVKAILSFKPIDRIDPAEFEKYRLAIENALIAA